MFLKRSNRERLKSMSAEAYAYELDLGEDRILVVRPTSMWQKKIRQGKWVRGMHMGSNGKPVAPCKFWEPATLREVVKEMKKIIKDKIKTGKAYI